MQEQQYKLEKHFTSDVISFAERQGWTTFHLRDRNHASIVRGKGFPDLIMYRKDADTGGMDLIAAELKRDANSELREEQRKWINALGCRIPAYTWRPDDWADIEAVLIGNSASRIGDPSIVTTPSNAYEYSMPRFETIDAVIEDIKDMSNGDRASLRHMDPASPTGDAFWRIAAQVNADYENTDVIRKWGLITHGIALMTHKTGQPHNDTIAVGRALYEGASKNVQSAFYSKERLMSLLKAEGVVLSQLLATLFRMLASQGVAFNWVEMTQFIFNEKDREAFEKSKHRIAGAYFQSANYNTRRNAKQGDA